MRPARIDVAALVLLIASTLTCKAAEPLPELSGGAELGLRRGGAWSTLKVRPPYVIGPRVNLQMKKKVFSGTIDSDPVSLEAEPDGIKGTGPNGAVAIDIDDTGDRLVIEGTWSGSHVHFEVTAETMKGSVALRSLARELQDTRGTASGRDLQDRPEALSKVRYCQYVFDKVEANGARSGTSICAGMPEPTLLEVPASVQGWLTRSELVVVLLALLSAPPTANAESFDRWSQ